MVPTLATRLAAVLLISAPLGCGDSATEPPSAAGSEPAPAVALAPVLSDPWLATIIRAGDPLLRSEVAARSGSGTALRALLEHRLERPEDLAPGDAVALAVLHLALLSESPGLWIGEAVP